MVKENTNAEMNGEMEQLVMTTEDANRLYDRLRETEAQNREQNVKLDSLTAQVAALVDHSQRFMDLTERRDERMWKLVIILVGALVGCTLGPKAVKTVMDQWSGNVAAVVDIIPLHTDSDRHGMPRVC